MVKTNTNARMVLRYLFATGVNHIYRWDDITAQLAGTASGCDIADGLQQLVDAKLLTLTGYNDDVIYFKDLELAHSLDVISRDPARYRFTESNFAPLGQLSLGIQLPLDRSTT